MASGRTIFARLSCFALITETIVRQWMELICTTANCNFSGSNGWWFTSTAASRQISGWLGKIGGIPGLKIETWGTRLLWKGAGLLLFVGLHGEVAFVAHFLDLVRLGFKPVNVLFFVLEQIDEEVA